MIPLIVSIIYSIVKSVLIIASIMLSLLILYILYIMKKRREYAHIPSPQIKHILFGHFYKLSLRNTHLKFVEWARDHGPIYQVSIFHKVFVVCNSPESVKIILTNSKYLKPKKNYEALSRIYGARFLGTGLVTNTEHENWKLRRNGINPSFHRNVVSGFVQMFNDVADRLIIQMEEHAGTNQLVSMLELLHNTTLDAIGQAAFSEDIIQSEKEGDSNNSFCESVSRCLKTLPNRNRNILYEYMPWKRQEIASVRKDVEFLRNKGKTMIEKRLKAIANGEKTPEDILDSIVRHLAGICSMEELVDEVITMFIAGQETTANLLAFFILAIERYDQYKEKIYDEVDSVLGEKRFVTEEDTTKLKWITASIKETLRLFPPITGTVRQIPQNEDLTFNGIRIPGGTSVLVSFHGVHYIHHKDGYAFKPERFFNQYGASSTVDEDGADLSAELFTYLPFSLGSRSCVGRNFAYLEAKIIAAKLLQRFRFQLNPDETFDVENAGTLKPADGAKVFITSR